MARNMFQGYLHVDVVVGLALLQPSLRPLDDTFYADSIETMRALTGANPEAQENRAGIWDSGQVMSSGGRSASFASCC